jgi:hypothetical protein
MYTPALTTNVSHFSQNGTLKTSHIFTRLHELIPLEVQGLTGESSMRRKPYGDKKLSVWVQFSMR